MSSGMRTVVYPVRDLGAANALYGALLGAAPHTDAPYYVGFRVGEQEIGLDPNGHARGMAGPVGFWHVDDIEAALAGLLAAGAEAVEPVREVGGGRRIATVRDRDGNVVGVLQDR